MISVSHLTKYYGTFPAVEELSFTIQPGQVYGFLGPNGAGKSTTMNIITGCLSPTSGTVTVGGYSILDQPKQAKRLIGYLPEQPPLYPNDTPLEYLTFAGEAKGLRGKALRSAIAGVLASTGIEAVADQLIGTLSKGYRQRVGIAQAILGDPEVIILDEPTVGLDPQQLTEIRELIRSLGEKHTVILSSHILSEVQAVCDTALIINHGHLVAFDTLENLEHQLLSQRGIELKVRGDEAAAREVLEVEAELAEFTVSAEGSDLAVTARLTPEADPQEVCGRLSLAFASRGMPVFEMQVKKANLEEVFLELTEAQEPAPPENQEIPQENSEEPEASEALPEITESGEEDENAGNL